MNGDKSGSLHELPWPILASDSRLDLANDLMTYCIAVGSWLLETFNVRWLLQAPPGLIQSEILRPAQTVFWMFFFFWLTEQTAIISLYGINWSGFRCVRKIAKSTNNFLSSICLSVRPHGTTLFPPDRIKWNLIFEYFFENLSRKFKFH